MLSSVAKPFFLREIIGVPKNKPLNSLYAYTLEEAYDWRGFFSLYAFGHTALITLESGGCRSLFV